MKEERSVKQYKKVNAYSHRASKEQILTLVLFFIQIALSSVFLIRPIIQTNQIILYFIFILTYFLILIMTFDYCRLTCSDPVDRMIIDKQENAWVRKNNLKNQQKSGNQENSRNNQYKTEYCKQCESFVKSNSHHCWRCYRCTEGMDHHCKYLNNCIGVRNYIQFFRLLISTTGYLLIEIGKAIWIFVETFNQQRINQLTFSRWAVLVLLIYDILLLLSVDSLLIFHCYLSCYRHMTTFQYLYRDTQSNKSSELQSASKEKLQEQNYL